MLIIFSCVCWLSVSLWRCLFSLPPFFVLDFLFSWADCGSDHELLTAKFRIKLKKVGENTRIFSHDWNQISYDYTVEVRDRFKRLDRQSVWRTVDRGLWHCRGGRHQDHPLEKEMQKGKMVVWGGLTNRWEKKRSKMQRRKGKIPIWR